MRPNEEQWGYICEEYKRLVDPEAEVVSPLDIENALCDLAGYKETASALRKYGDLMDKREEEHLALIRDLKADPTKAVRAIGKAASREIRIQPYYEHKPVISEKINKLKEIEKMCQHWQRLLQAQIACAQHRNSEFGPPNDFGYRQIIGCKRYKSAKLEKADKRRRPNVNMITRIGRRHRGGR